MVAYVRFTATAPQADAVAIDAGAMLRVSWLPLLLTTTTTTTSCASVRSQETSIDTDVPASHRRQVVADSRDFAVEAGIDGETIALMITQRERCLDVTTPRIHRVHHVERHLEAATSLYEWGLACLVPAGGITYLDADGLAASTNNMGNGKANTPDSYRSLGLSMIGIGSLAAFVGVVDALRAADSDEDRGVISGTPREEETECHEAPAALVEVQLALGAGQTMPGKTDHHGRVAIALTEVPAPALPSEDAPPMVYVEGKPYRLDITTERREALLAALRANPASRLARDRAAQQESACHRALGSARIAPPGDPFQAPTKAVTAWEEAKSTCADLWQASDEAELVAAIALAVRARCDQAIARVAAAIAGVDDRAALTDVTEGLATATTRCPGDPRLGALEARVAASGKAVADRERREAQQAELRELREQRDAALRERHEAAGHAMQTGNAEQAWTLLAGAPAMRSLVTAEDREGATQLLIDTLSAVLNGNRPQAANDVCYARKVYERLLGAPAMRALVQKIVASYGAKDPALVSRVVGALKGGRCPDHATPPPGH